MDHTKWSDHKQRLKDDYTRDGTNSQQIARRCLWLSQKVLSYGQFNQIPEKDSSRT